MAKVVGNVLRIVCTNTIQENEKRLFEARIKNKKKNQTRQNLNKLFRKLNQVEAEKYLVKNKEKLSPSCYNKTVTNCIYGPVSGFLSGSWWGIRMDLSRDRVHNPFDIDIDEGFFGVASVCTSHNNINQDVDFGDFLTITGQIYCEKQPNSDPFIRNYENQIPLRLIRGYNLQNDIAPNIGYRYDGLYIIIDYWIGADMNGSKYNKFALMRLTDQEPSSWNNKALKSLSSPQHYISPTDSYCSKICSPSNIYDLRKCLYNTDGIYGKQKLNHRNSCNTLPVLKTAPSINNRKSASESSIVTRHVFKKPNNMENTICSTSVPDQKMLTCLGMSTSKAHSTNISLRMGLYESSHNTQEVKRNVSTMLYKPFKPIDIANRTALNIEGIYLPLKEDNKPFERMGADKTQIDSQIENSESCNEHIMADNVVEEFTCPLKKRRKNLCSYVLSSSEHSYIVSSSLNSSNYDTENTTKYKELCDVQQTANVSTQKTNSKEFQKKSNEGNKISKCYRTLEIPSENSVCAQNIKSLRSLDTMTPDKILNLINKEKHHPLSKLLIENVIGLSIKECTTWDRSKVKIPDISTKTNNKRRDNVKENVVCLSEDVLTKRYCKYSKSKRLPWRITKQTDIGKFDKKLPRQSLNDTDKNCNGKRSKIKSQSNMSTDNEYLSSFHKQSSLQAISQHTRSSYDVKTRLKTNKQVMLKKQEFSNSSIKKNRYKKQDREIANLLIDANIGPKARGPRNRRLRCINNTYTNMRCYSTFNVTYLPGKRNSITKKQHYKSNFNRKSKLTKTNRQHTRGRQSKDRYRVSNVLRTKSSDKNINNSIGKGKHFDVIADNNDDRNYNNNENRRKSNKIVSDNRNASKISFDKNRRKELAQTVPLSRHVSQTSHLYYFRKKQMAEKPKTNDATTQCRLIFEEPIENILQKAVENEHSKSTFFGQLVDQRAVVKIKQDKIEKLKSESIRNVAQNDRNSLFYETSLRLNSSFKEDKHYTDIKGPSRKRISTERSLNDRTSAFVPVNTIDTDLRIARLRSIGFKPIIKPRSPLVHERTIQNDQEDALVNTRKVTKRNVAEEYIKYTSNENNSVVVYMDDELQYQDIEQEEDESSSMKDRTSLINASMKYTLKNVQSNVDTVFLEALASRDNIESPWHGWQKIVMNNRSYWIGW